MKISPIFSIESFKFVMFSLVVAGFLECAYVFLLLLCISLSDKLISIDLCVTEDQINLSSSV